MSITKITAALDVYGTTVDAASAATKDATVALDTVLRAFGSTTVGDKALAGKISKAHAALIGGGSSQKIGNTKKIGKQVNAGRLIVDTWEPKVLAKVSGKAQNVKDWNAYWAGLEDGATVSLSALASADDLASATAKKEQGPWDARKAVESLVAKADKEGMSRDALVALLREVATPTLAVVPGEAA